MCNKISRDFWQLWETLKTLQHMWKSRNINFILLFQSINIITNYVMNNQGEIYPPPILPWKTSHKINFFNMLDSSWLAIQTNWVDTGLNLLKYWMTDWNVQYVNSFFVVHFRQSVVIVIVKVVLKILSISKEYFWNMSFHVTVCVLSLRCGSIWL